MTFDSFDLYPHILARVQALGFKIPTPIQQQSIPAILQGRDVMGLAKTGTGKTAAFLLPILQRLGQGPRGQVRALIIAPTRELAHQIHEDVVALGKGSGLRSVTLYGGVNIQPQIQKLRHGVEIVVGCPGRLLDHLDNNTLKLTHVEMVVLDEADHMLDMGFLPNIRRILKKLPAKYQALLFSATMPTDIRQLADDILRNPVNVQIANTEPTTTVSQALYPVPDNLKTQLLLKILQTTDTQSVLVFTRTKHRAKKVADQLSKAGYRSTSLQGNLSQNKRQSALNDFRKGILQILVATDIASRGIDVALISHVINYDMPGTVESYTHRIGRTGRAAKLGDAFTLITRADLPKVRAIERILGKQLEQRTIADFDYKAVTPLSHDDIDTPPRRSFSQRPTANKRSSSKGTWHAARQSDATKKQPHIHLKKRRPTMIKKDQMD